MTQNVVAEEQLCIDRHDTHHKSGIIYKCSTKKSNAIPLGEHWIFYLLSVRHIQVYLLKLCIRHTLQFLNHSMG